METFLFDIEPADSSVYAVVFVVGLALVLLASWLPARKAARVDPMDALRHE